MFAQIPMSLLFVLERTGFALRLEVADGRIKLNNKQPVKGFR